jgi:hypothetical protein
MIFRSFVSIFVPKSCGYIYHLCVNLSIGIIKQKQLSPLSQIIKATDRKCQAGKQRFWHVLARGWLL